ncbi:hypothetical protein [Candidatus Borrarchaeum sp.]|uniref:hypothetical protein n=1 Tax=Candidatus Borrarchaeum sp. TaxID=2846742 RepID=UPI00257F2593|nr:hypothetical protein [Candidatus Borrarchaeum sp.]
MSCGLRLYFLSFCQQTFQDGVSFIITLIGGAAFAAAYSYYEWWFEPGFYGGTIAGLLNSILFFLKGRM